MIDWALTWPVRSELGKQTHMQTDILCWNFKTKKIDKILKIQKNKKCISYENGNQISIKLLIGTSGD